MPSQRERESDFYLIPKDVLANWIERQDSLAMRPTTPAEHEWAASVKAAGETP